MIKNLIFDLDGTLLDTITDIRRAINDALKASGTPLSYSKKETKRLVGDGADTLIHRSLGPYDTERNFAKLKAEYLPRYGAYQEDHTKAFNGIVPTLEYLKNKGISLFVCTNKPDAYAKIIVEKFFGTDLFLAIRGLREGELPKPNPAIVDSFVERFSLNKEETVFVGDSITDLHTAQNAGLPLALCLYGYGQYKKGLLDEAAYLIEKPKDIARIIR